MTSSDGQKRHALLIGIDKYPNLSASAQLKGCANDAALVRTVLLDHFGFDSQNVRLISDEQATRDGILGELDALNERVGEDDIVVVHYAGHGSVITDLEGDEPDGLDSTVVPHDAVRPKGDPDNPGHTPPNVDITDDEIHAWLQKVCRKTPYVTLIFDCCHSGSMSQSLF